ncbi:MAG: efflux transporter outer membrane subunit, partial [Pseudomonadota bacterium]|nr:efflux transporter outer membrane subunit [Pseudomonadota bacterium]
AALAHWWRQLGDPLLSELVVTAIAENHDLAEAAARVSEARHRRGLAAAQRWPSATAGGSASRVRTAPDDAPATTTRFYDVSVDARWQTGLFGGTRRELEAADADWEAEIANRDDLLVSVAAEVALNYLDLRLFQTRLAITERNLATQTETLDLARWRHQAGLTTAIDVEQARQNVEQTRAQLPLLRAGSLRASHRLAVLLGGYPGALDGKLATPGPIPIAGLKIAIGVPADVLRRRPDVRAAERRLAAQTARVGAAIADRYPELTLTGSIGLEALSGGDLLDAGTEVTSTLASLGLTLFDAGRIRQNIAVQTAVQEQALARFEGVVRGAVEEVENALVAYAQEQRRHTALAEAAAAAELAARLIEQQYRTGLVDFQTVLDAQRSLLNLQDQVAISRGEITTQLIAIYQAVGGGWMPAQQLGAGQAGIDPAAGEPDAGV